MGRPHVTLPFGLFLGTLLALALTLALIALLATPARGAPESPQAFHLAEITKILVGYNGDTQIQAVEIKMTAAAENSVSGMEIAVYDSLGTKLTTLGTFSGNVPNGLNGDNILCATSMFATAFGITPDLVLTPGIRVTTGQVAYEKVSCRVNVIPYGAVITPLTSPTAAPPLPAGGATALVRIAETPTSPFCPHAENAGARFELRSGNAGNPLVFRNNLRDTTQVWTTVAAVGDEAPRAPRLHASPNPFRVRTRIHLPGPVWRVAIQDVQGRRVRVWEGLGWIADGSARYSVEWDGRDDRGRALPSGLYFIRTEGSRVERAHARVLLLR